MVEKKDSPSVATTTTTPSSSSVVDKKNQPKSTISDKVKCIWKNITVEPLLASYIMPSVLASLATQNLNLEKACRVNMGYTDEICDALSRRETANYTTEEKMVQQLVAGMAVWKTILQSGLPCMLILFWGSWSDRHGRRKPCMLFPIFGEFLASIGLLVCTYYKNTPMEVAGVTEALFPGLTGGWFTMLMGVFSYVADITTKEERTLRIGIVNLCISLGVPIGMAFSGVLLKKIGFYGIFSISASLHLFALCYGIFYVKEPKMSIEKQAKLSAVATSSPSSSSSVSSSNKRNIIMDFFDKEHVIETFKVAFKSGAKQRRLRVIMLIIVVIVVDGPLHGEMSVFYLFTRFQFNWSEVEFSIFSTYNMLVGLLGTMFSVGLFSHILQIEDSLIGVMSSMSKILSSLVYAFAKTDWQIYCGPIVEILNGTSFIAMRSIASKLVSNDELGKVNSLFGVAEALVPLIYTPLYASVYSASLNVLPGAFFLLGGAMTMPAVIIFLWMYRVHKREAKDLKMVDDLPPTIDETIKKSPLFIEKTIKPSSLANGTEKLELSNKLLRTDNKMTIICEKDEYIEQNGGGGGVGELQRTHQINKCYDNSAYEYDDEKFAKNLNKTTATTINMETIVPDTHDIGILPQTINIVKELPALHLEHCKL